MRSSNRKTNLTVLTVLALMVGCAAPLTQLQRAEQQFQATEAEHQKQEAEAKAALEEADVAAKAQAEAGKGLSTALLTDAEEKIEMVEGVIARAEAQRKRACELNPELDFCKKAAPPPAQAPAEQPPPAQKAGDPPPQAAPPLSYVDIKVNDFNLAGLERLTDYPPGWKVTFDSDKGEVTLMIDGEHAYGYSKPATFKPVCLRFGATAATLCPAEPPPGPAAPPLPAGP